MDDPLVTDDARALVADLTVRRQSVATAESLTAGLLAATLAGVAGASVVLRGGLVTYIEETKIGLAGVAPQLLDAVGPVLHEDGVSGCEACVARRRTTVQLDSAGRDRGIKHRAPNRQELPVVRFESEALDDVAEGRARSDLVRRVAHGDLERGRGRRCDGLAVR